MISDNHGPIPNAHIHATDCIKLRTQLGLTQSQFAAALGISIDTLQNWEQQRRSPSGPARVLLRIAAADPEVLLGSISQPNRSLPRRRKTSTLELPRASTLTAKHEDEAASQSVPSDNTEQSSEESNWAAWS